MSPQSTLLPATDASSAQREAFYQQLPPLQLGALWNVLANTLTPEPTTRSLPYLWQWSDVRPLIMRAGELVTAEEAERRVLYFLNPGLPPEQLRVVGSLYEGELAYTTVSGERTLMRKGDYVTTPNWTWHDHGNESDRPMLWLDGLDLPLVTDLDAVFFEEFAWQGDGPVQPVTKPPEDSTHRWGSNLRPTYERHTGRSSPVLNYRWQTCRGALHALREDQGSRYDGIILEYVNPHTGGPSLPTMSAYLQLLRKGEHTRAHRHTSSTVYHVAEGGGTSIIGGQEFRWQEGDTFVVPSWAWHEHAAEAGEAVLFSFSDRPVLEAFGLWREEAAAEPGVDGGRA